LQRHALFALEKLGDRSVINQVVNVWNHSNSLVRDEFIGMCATLNPNSPTSIKHFVEGVKIESIPARHALYSVTDATSILTLLDYFSSDMDFLTAFFEHGSIYEDTDNKIIKNIEHIWSDEIRKKLEQFVLRSFESEHWYDAEKSLFLKEIALLVKRHTHGFIFFLLKEIPKSERLKRNSYSMQSIFSALLEKDQVKEFVNIASKVSSDTWLAFRTLQGIFYSKRHDAKEMYKEPTSLRSGF